MTAIIESYLKEEIINGLKKETINTHRTYLQNVHDWKPLDSEWTKDEINNYIIELSNKYKQGSIENIKNIIRKFFKWNGKPELVSHIKVKMPKGTLKREDILTVEEIDKLIETTPSTLYKALIAFLFESGARINEALPTLVKDIQETDNGMVISIHSTKTGDDYRRGLYTYSAQFIRNHITYKALKSDDKIFDVNDVSAWSMIRNIGKQAGINKPVSPHKFRHARATDLVLRKYQESLIRKKLGWTADSRMISRYQHIVDEDVINADAEMSGNDIIRKPLANIKQAEKLSIADSSMQLSKLSDENEMMKEKLRILEQKEADREKAEAEEQKYIDEENARLDAEEEEREKANKKKPLSKEEMEMFIKFQKFMEDSKNFPKPI